jgi:dTDP-4-dehydrorhamnose 3,5-epimerase|tara:strand:- start:1083 stop:1535 length:453 start_codon:yes stop_codon:yes gene_type:complete
MIQGVKLKKIATHSDKRGYFREILRKDQKLMKQFGQASISLTNPGIIKAFHWHKRQDDIFYVASGKALVALYDRRKNSKTHGKKMAVQMDENYPKLLFIPKKVAHGYKALGKKPLVMLYFMSHLYDKENPDEQRISYDSKEIRFNWAKYR